MSERARLAKLTKAIKAIDRTINRKWQRAYPVLKRYIREGDYQGETIVRRRIFEEVERLRHERTDLRLMMPPFVIEKDGILCLQPVTPENRHLLLEIP
jgi:hypothetical protein